MTDQPLAQEELSYTKQDTRPAIVAPAASEPAPPLLLLPEHAVGYRRSVQYVSGVAALVLMFFASASLTAAYLFKGVEGAALAAQTAAAAAPIEDPFATVSVAAQSAYVLDLTTDRVLYSKNADTKLPLASLSKVALVLAVSEVFPAGTEITIPAHSPPDGAGIRLPAGLRFRAEDLIDFTLVASSNEGAAILADAADGALRAKYPQASPHGAALWRMNDIAQHLGLSSIVFLNTSGLDVDDTQAGSFGSAHDVARLFGYAATTAPDSFGHTSRSNITIRATTGETVPAANTDEALPAIPGIIVGKTGFTELAGGNLAIVFEVGPAHPVVAVVLHSTLDGRFADMKNLVAATVAAISAGQ